MRNQRLSQSFAVNQNDVRESKTTKARTKARTFYGQQDLEDIIQSKRSKFELDANSPNHNLDVSITSRRTEKPLPSHQRKQYTVKENALRGVYVQNLSEVTCKNAESAYHCLLDGLMRKRMSQTARNTSSSRSHTIFQIKMYMKK